MIKIKSNTYFIKRNYCPGCKSTKFRTIYSCWFLESPIKEYLESFYSTQGQIIFEYLKDVKFILNECNECGIIYQEEIPNNFFMKIIYEDWIDPEKKFNLYTQKEYLDHYSTYIQEIMMLIDYFNVNPRRLKFFDFGMGWGRWCLMAKAYGCDVYGTELSEKKIKYAESYGIKVITWDEILNYNFDFINTEQVFEHIPNPFETLCHLKKSLKPTGLIKISVPNGKGIKRKLRILDWTAPKGSRNSLNPVSPLEHINCFNRTSILKMADKVGLKPVKIPLTIQYSYITNWKLTKHTLKNLLKPIYTNMFQKGTYLFFR